MSSRAFRDLFFAVEGILLLINELANNLQDPSWQKANQDDIGVNIISYALLE